MSQIPKFKVIYPHLHTQLNDSQWGLKWAVLPPNLTWLAGWLATWLANLAGWLASFGWLDDWLWITSSGWLAGWPTLAGWLWLDGWFWLDGRLTLTGSLALAGWLTLSGWLAGWLTSRPPDHLHTCLTLDLSFNHFWNYLSSSCLWSKILGF